jgi:TetR/AcrR family transcriptional regulator, transcriptional repressor of bet genes
MLRYRAVARIRDVDDQRERLSAAVWSVLAERGLPGLTVRAVAERAGCSTGLVMHAFADRAALLAHARTVLHNRTAARADAVTGTPQEILRGVLLEGAPLTSAKREEARVWIGFLAAALADPALAALHRRYNRAFVRRLQSLVADSHPEWTDQAVGQYARELAALIEGLNTLAAVDPQTYPAATIRAALDNALAAAEGR